MRTLNVSIITRFGVVNAWTENCDCASKSTPCENAQELICKVYFLLDKTTRGVLDPTPPPPGRLLSNQGTLWVGRRICGAQIKERCSFPTIHSDRRSQPLAVILSFSKNPPFSPASRISVTLSLCYAKLELSRWVCGAGKSSVKGQSCAGTRFNSQRGSFGVTRCTGCQCLC